jgi:hypothetical protein
MWLVLQHEQSHFSQYATLFVCYNVLSRLAQSVGGALKG